MTNPVATIRHVTDHGDLYDAIMLWCPGCSFSNEDSGLTMLPVTGDANKRATWGWNNDLVNVTMEPSILSKVNFIGGKVWICHSFLRDGVWEFLSDSTHALAGQKVPMVPLPDWVVREVKEDGSE